jgi:cobalamin-dependent methionine synthase I
MAAACLREDRWHVHDLGADLPTDELIAFTEEVGATLVVLSSTTPGAVRTAAKEAREIRERLPNVRVLTGRPGDTLARLRDLARTPAADGPGTP